MGVRRRTGLGPGSAILSRRPAKPVSGIALGLWLVIVGLSAPGRPWSAAQEAWCYWIPSIFDPYRQSDWTSPVAYVYSPAFLEAIAPLRALSWTAFVAIWTALLLGAVMFLTGPRLLWLGVLVAAAELYGGNISLFLAVAIVLGFRWPVMWAFVILTKVTPGIGLLWFAVRREWRNLGIALAATAIVAGASAVSMPVAWQQWVHVLIANAGRDGTWAAVPVALWVRLPMAAALVIWGARTDRRWTVPVASMLALPALWFGSLSMLLAVIALAPTRGAAESDDAAPRGRPPRRCRTAMGQPDRPVRFLRGMMELPVGSIQEEAAVPTYMDMHDIPGVKAEDVVGAHEADLKIQGKYGVDYTHYWVDEKEGKVFCLVTAPDRETATRVHREAHGLEAHTLYEVEQGA